MPDNYGDSTAEPRQGDSVQANLTIKVGSSNGDFRYVTFYDHLDRALATGCIPFRALREIREHAS